MSTIPGVTRPSDASITLALLLADDRLAEIETTLRKTYNTLNNDEGGAGFVADHNQYCPAWTKMNGRPMPCACGFDALRDDVREALRDVEEVRNVIARCVGTKPQSACDTCPTPHDCRAENGCQHPQRDPNEVVFVVTGHGGVQERIAATSLGAAYAFMLGRLGYTIERGAL